jgi:hypothetical protein
VFPAYATTHVVQRLRLVAAMNVVHFLHQKPLAAAITTAVSAAP